MNKVLLIGRISRKTQLRQTQSGVSYTRLTLAVTRKFQGANQQESQADFIPIVAWRNTATLVDNFYEVGDLVSIEGSFSASSYKNSNNEFVNNNEVSVENINHLENQNTRENRKKTSNSYDKNSENKSNTDTYTVNKETFSKENVNQSGINSDEIKEEEDTDWNLEF